VRLPSAGSTKRRQRARKERRPILAVVVGCHEQEGLSLPSGPPIVPDNWFSSSGNSAGLIRRWRGGHDAGRAEGAQNPFVENVSACQRRDAPGEPFAVHGVRARLVTMFIAARMSSRTRPGENAFDSTATS